ncbi:DNA-binding protein [Cutibacterium acnes]|uniref:DNA-binding protein n=1 Tax=Cutibacterium acnes TaxID=1747 RepID=A0AAD0QMM2_CUTAC|nr:DNA-binding protein [Cutibacterium acnes]PGF36833.1 DNA-binding protein [Cutibacterium acnes subsp. acnes]QAZ50831.1 DNA-binding protein [Cutibacterium acnes KPA171202]PGF37764.1 DNA-binding protein [Cutibacterium acnes subsp. acnes]PLA25162.1 DNA-binding protein [Cutibacterium acnes]
MALGISSAAAVLKPAKPSIATIQMPSRQVWDWAGSQVLKTYFKRSSTIASLLRPRALHTFRT